MRRLTRTRGKEGYYFINFEFTNKKTVSLTAVGAVDASLKGAVDQVGCVWLAEVVVGGGALAALRVSGTGRVDRVHRGATAAPTDVAVATVTHVVGQVQLSISHVKHLNSLVRKKRVKMD